MVCLLEQELRRKPYIEYCGIFAFIIINIINFAVLAKLRAKERPMIDYMH